MWETLSRRLTEFQVHLVLRQKSITTKSCYSTQMAMTLPSKTPRLAQSSLILVVEKLGEDGAVTNVIGQPVRIGEGATATNTEATFTQTHGTLANYANETHTLTDGTTTLSITVGASTPTTADLVSAFRSATGYNTFKFDVSANGATGFTFTAREPGVIQTAEQPVLTAAAAVTDEGALTAGTAGAAADSTRISGTLKFVSSHSFSVEQAGATKATFTQTHGTLSNYASATHTLSDGVTTLSIRR